MENTDQPKKKKFDLASYGIVVGFLCLEILAFISFYLGHSFILYGSLAIALAILSVLVTLKQINKDGLTSFAFFIFPLLIFVLLTALSSFNHDSIGAIGTAESVFIPLGFTFISIAGFLTAYIEKFKIKTAMLIIYGALALYVLINLIINMVYFVPFYTIIYKNSYIVYAGHPSPLPIGSMAYMLFGFQVLEVSIEYWSLFPAILLTAVIPLFFIKFKENRRDFILYAVMTGIAFISLLFTISKIALIADFVLIAGIAVIILAAKVHQSRQILNIMMLTIGIIIFIVCLLFFLLAQTTWGALNGLRNAFKGNALLNRLFITNRYSSAIIVVLQGLFVHTSQWGFFKLFGIAVGGTAGDYPPINVKQVPSNIWLFDNVLSSGLFGAIFFMVFIVLGIRRLFKYIKGTEEDYVKYLIAGYVLGFLVISLLFYDVTPLVYSNKLFPIYTSAPLLICVFLLIYVFNKTLSLPNAKKEEEKKEEPKVEENDDEVLSL